MVLSASRGVSVGEHNSGSGGGSRYGYDGGMICSLFVVVVGGSVDVGNNGGVCFCTTGVITLKSLVGQGPHWLWTVMCDRHVCASPSWAVKLLHKT